jgi:hypothetical protein
MAFEVAQVGQSVARQLDVDDVVTLLLVEVAVDAIAEAPDVAGVSDHPFAAQEPARELEIGSWRAHRHGKPASLTRRDQT